MQIEDVIENKELKSNKYVLVENKGTFAERILSVYDTEIEELRIYKKVSTKLKLVVKANVTYAKIENKSFIYDY